MGGSRKRKKGKSKKGQTASRGREGVAEGDAGDAAVAACLRDEVTPAISASSACGSEHVATSPAPSASKSRPHETEQSDAVGSADCRLSPGRPGAAHTVTGARAAGERGSQDMILAGVQALGQQQDFAQAAASPARTTLATDVDDSLGGVQLEQAEACCPAAPETYALPPQGHSESALPQRGAMKPERAVTAGALVWLRRPVGAEGPWVAAQVLATGENGAIVASIVEEDGGDGTAEEVYSDGWELREPLFSKRNADRNSAGCEDCCELHYLNEPSILENLQSRAAAGQIYTRAGEILIAINPYRELDIYDAETVLTYMDSEDCATQLRQTAALPPHVFQTAMAAYRAMARDERAQCILVSGESGAGKTETTKKVMIFLSSVAAGASLHRGQDAAVGDVCARILATNPVLEAFGNAKTVRNDNSSRFGKYIELRFNRSGYLTGGYIRTYLLERSRVVRINSPERTYHIFYQLCAAGVCSPAQSAAGGFDMLRQSECTELRDVDDAREFAATREAMETLGIDEQSAAEAFGILAAILHLGNVSFSRHVDAAEESALDVDDVAQAALRAAASHLGCDQSALRAALSTRTIYAAGESFVKELNPDDARSSREALCKVLYSKLFGWIVLQLNHALRRDVAPEAGAGSAASLDSLAAAEHDRTSIGILDIYGFEWFDTCNSFEQLCINWANERLQQFFNAFVFKTQQAEYEAEGIEWSFVTFRDNDDVLDAIEQNMVPLLDDQCRMPSGSDSGYVASLRAALLPANRFRESRRDPDSTFTVVHFAGAVEYTAKGFCEKNKEFVVPEHAKLMQESSTKLLTLLFAPASGCLGREPDVGDGSKTAGGGSRPATHHQPSTKFTSVGLSFRTQLRDLMSALERTDPHFVRCIKPNSEASPEHFDSRLVLEQLRSGGVSEAVRVMQAGFPARRTYEDFASRYRVLVTGAAAAAPNEVAKGVCEAVVLTLGLSTAVQMGKTKIFLRAGHLSILETTLRELQREAVTCIQACARRAMHRRAFSALRGATIATQRRWRGVLARRAAQALREERAVLLLATWWKFRRSVRRKHAAVTIQMAWRAISLRGQYLRMRAAVRTLQAASRATAARRTAHDLRASTREAAKLAAEAKGLRQELSDARGRSNQLMREVAALTAALEAASAESAEVSHAIDTERQRTNQATERIEVLAAQNAELLRGIEDANARAELAARAAANAATAALEAADAAIREGDDSSDSSGEDGDPKACGNAASEGSDSASTQQDADTCALSVTRARTTVHTSTAESAEEDGSTRALMAWRSAARSSKVMGWLMKDKMQQHVSDIARLRWRLAYRFVVQPFRTRRVVDALAHASTHECVDASRDRRCAESPPGATTTAVALGSSIVADESAPSRDISASALELHGKQIGEALPGIATTRESSKPPSAARALRDGGPVETYASPQRPEALSEDDALGTRLNSPPAAENSGVSRGTATCTPLAPLVETTCTDSSEGQGRQLKSPRVDAAGNKPPEAQRTFQSQEESAPNRTRGDAERVPGSAGLDEGHKAEPEHVQDGGMGFISSSGSEDADSTASEDDFARGAFTSASEWYTFGPRA